MQVLSGLQLPAMLVAPSGEEDPGVTFLPEVTEIHSHDEPAAVFPEKLDVERILEKKIAAVVVEGQMLGLNQCGNARDITLTFYDPHIGDCVARRKPGGCTPHGSGDGITAAEGLERRA
jgi:hypothetical protein